MSEARYFYTVDEDEFGYYAKEHYPEGASFNFLFDIQPFKVEKLFLEGKNGLSIWDLNQLIANKFIDLDASFDWWDDFINPEVGLFSVKGVKEVADYFQSSYYEKGFEKKLSEVDKVNQEYIRETLEKLAQFFISASEKDLAIMSYYE